MSYTMSDSSARDESSSPNPSSRIVGVGGVTQKCSELTPPFGHTVKLPAAKVIQTAVCSVTIFLIRLLLLILTLPLTALCAHLASRYISHDEEPKGWKRSVASTACCLGRLQLRIAGLRITINGKAADPKEARILVLAPHSALVDGFCLLYHAKWTHLPSPISASENRSIPIIGQLLSVAKPIFVDREDADSKKNVAGAITKRAKSLNFPQVAIFPEGTNTNRKALLSFKPGAFNPGLPVQPIILRYSGWDTYTWTYGQNISNLGALCFLTLCQPVIYLEMEYMDVYKPNREEKSNPVLFAGNVAALMGEKLKIPISDWGMENGRLLTTALELGLTPSVVDFNYFQISKQTGLHWRDMKLLLREFKFLEPNEAQKVKIKIVTEYLTRKIGEKLEKNSEADFENPEKLITFGQFVQLTGKILKDHDMIRNL
jgi:lysophosphatidylcholine acyltransferase/lyso-PAF acetyltransferase